jgi:Na+-transporting NADH:ubiquinone oxidoreductase subunit A
MAKTIRIKQVLDIPLAGKAQEITKWAATSSFYTLFPDDFHGFIPKVAVKQGDKVLAGTPVLYDKNRTELKVVSPVSGEIAAVNRGEKRKLLGIVIQADSEKAKLDFGKQEVQTLSPETIKTALANSGLLAFIRQRPYDVVANPQDTPRDIFVSGFNTAPLSPNVEYILKGNEADFQTGLDALASITAGDVYLSIHVDCQSPALREANRVKVVAFSGAHPAGNVGVQINHIQPVNKGDVVWTVQPQDVIAIGRFFNHGQVDLTRLVAFTGSEVNEDARAYYPMLPGANIKSLVNCQVTETMDLRYISGNVLTGTRIAPDGSLHAFDNQITVVPEGDETHEFAGWIMPRINQFSVSRTYPAFILKMFAKKTYDMDARIKGGKRAMIMSNEWDKVFPMDIMPEFLIRAILAQDIDKMENLGIYEVAPEDFALCEFVDTSKMELQKIVRTGLNWLNKEMQ